MSQTTKVYVHEQVTRTIDGDLLIRVLTYESKPEKFDYILWI